MEEEDALPVWLLYGWFSRLGNVFRAVTWGSCMQYLFVCGIPCLQSRLLARSIAVVAQTQTHSAA